MTGAREEPGPEDIAAVAAPADPTGPTEALAAEAPEAARPAGAPPVLGTILTIGFVQAVTMGFFLARSKISAITVGPPGIGTISVVDQLVALVTQICTFSIPYTAVKFLSAAHSESRETFAHQYATFFRALLAASVAGAAVAIAVVSGWPSALGPKLAGSRSLVVLGLLAIPASNLTGLLTNTMAAARRTRASALVGLWTALTLAVFCGAGILSAKLFGFYVGAAAAWTLVAAGSLAYLSRKEGLGLRGPRFQVTRELKSHKAILRFAAAIYVISFTNPLAYLVARFSVLHFGDFHDAGILQAALGPALALATVMRSSNSLFLTPLMNRRIAVEEKFRGAVDFLKAFALATAFVALPVLLFPHLLISLLYSPKFLAAAAFASLFLVAETAQLLAGVNSALLIGLDLIGSHVAISITADAFLAGACLVLVPRYGISGVALAFLGNGLLTFALTAWRIWKKHRVAIVPAAGPLPALVLAAMFVTGTVAKNFASNAPAVLGVKAGVLAAFGLLFLASKPARAVLPFLRPRPR